MKHTIKAICMGGSALTLVPLAAAAQTFAEKDNSAPHASVRDIVVTAPRRSLRLQGNSRNYGLAGGSLGRPLSYSRTALRHARIRIEIAMT